MYDFSKMIFVEESTEGYTTCLKVPGGRIIEVSFLPISDKEDKNFTHLKALGNAQELMNGILDIFSEVSGEYMFGQLVKTVKVNR